MPNPFRPDVAWKLGKRSVEGHIASCSYVAIGSGNMRLLTGDMGLACVQKIMLEMLIITSLLWMRRIMLTLVHVEALVLRAMWKCRRAICFKCKAHASDGDHMPLERVGIWIASSFLLKPHDAFEMAKRSAVRYANFDNFENFPRLSTKSFFTWALKLHLHYVFIPSKGLLSNLQAQIDFKESRFFSPMAKQRKGYVNPLMYTYGFLPAVMIGYCLMHCLHLGILHFLNGAALAVLLDHSFFGSLDPICP